MPNVEPIVESIAEPATAPPAAATPRWVEVLYIALVAYVVIDTVWMLAGFGGPQVTHYVALLSDAPATLVCAIILGATARHTPRGASRVAWSLLALALALYFVGVVIGVSAWLQGFDPFPGTADIFYCLFYPALTVAALLLMRAAQVRVPWMQLSLDATIFVVGFGAFFWFLVLAPAAAHVQLAFLKEALSLAYLALDCVLLLTFGVLVLTGVGNAGGRRVPLLLLAGFAAMFLGDILWSLAKVRGYYLPGQYGRV